MRRLGLFPFSGLACNLLLMRLGGYLPESTLPEGHHESQSKRALLAGHQCRGALTILESGGHWAIASGATFLGN